MKATEAAKLTVRQIDNLLDRIMHQIRQAALDGESKTVFYLYPEYSRKDYSPLIDKLKEDGYSVKFEHISDPRDGDYSQLTISWKSHIMDKALASLQMDVEKDVETFDEIIDDLYKMADKHASLVDRDSELGRKYRLQSTIERNIAHRIEKTWKWMQDNNMIKKNRRKK